MCRYVRGGLTPFLSPTHPPSFLQTAQQKQQLVALQQLSKQPAPPQAGGMAAAEYGAGAGHEDAGALALEARPPVGAA